MFLCYSRDVSCFTPPPFLLFPFFFPRISLGLVSITDSVTEHRQYYIPQRNFTNLLTTCLLPISVSVYIIISYCDIPGQSGCNSPKGGRGCLMSRSCLESQGCHLIPLSYLLSCFFLPSLLALSVLSFFC